MNKWSTITTLLLTLLVACSTGPAAAPTSTLAPTHYRSEANHVEVDLPAGWVASEGPELLAQPFEGLLAFNSWGQENFWARQVESKTDGGGYSYSRETILSQLPVDGAYIVLSEFSGGPKQPFEDYGPEYSQQDLSSLWPEQDCRVEGAIPIQFYKWGWYLSLGVYCSPDVSDRTMAEVNQFLESWRFDKVPAGDFGWATVTARELLPAMVDPASFPVLTTGHPASAVQQGKVVRMTRAAIGAGEVVEVTFFYRWDAAETGVIPDYCPPESCHWWGLEAHPDGRVRLVEEGGAELPGENEQRLPSQAITVTPTIIPPTPVPIVCLDSQAKPVEVPARQEPFELRFISDGNVWVWEDGTPARQISDTGDAIRFTFSPDEQVVVIESQLGEYPFEFKFELWAINKDGSNLRQLVSTQVFDELLPAREQDWKANAPRDYRWIAGTHQLTFGVYPFIYAAGGSDAALAYWIVDADSLELKKWANPDFIDPYGPIEMPSPDGKVIALVDMQSISLVNTDGSIIRKDALTYPANRNPEGPGWGPPRVVWTPDSHALKVVVWDEDVFIESFSTWEIPTDGSPAQKLHTFSGMEYYAFISPNQEYLAYLRRTQEMSNEHELHLAKLDGSADVIYDTGYQLYFQGWAPDSFHFAYDLFATHQPLLGSVCGGTSELVDKGVTPVTLIIWVDADRFLFVVGQEGQPEELKLGQVGGKSISIAPFKGENAYFEVRQEGQDTIVP